MIRFLLRLRELFRKIGRGYGGVLLLVELGFLLTTGFVLSLLAHFRGVPPSLLVNRMFLGYAVAYWRIRLGLLLAGLFVVIVILAFQLDRSLYYRFFSPTAYWRLDARTRRGRAILVSVLSGPVIYLGLSLPPLLHLYYPAWIVGFAAFMPIPVAMTEYILLFWGDPAELRVVRSLTRSRVPVKTFNAAALGVRTMAAQRDLEAYTRSTETGPMSKDALDFIERGTEDGFWKGNDAFLRVIAEALGVPSESVELHDRTTDAIRAAVEEVVQSPRVRAQPPLFVTSDNEYESIEKLLEGLARSGKIRLEVVPIRTMIWNGASMMDISSRIMSSITSEVTAIVLSHVANDTGFVFDIYGLESDADKKLGNQVLIWIIDGAQALGNILVSQPAINRSDYYATCGHKWLGGKPTLGILIRNVRRMSTTAVSFNPRSLSRLGDARPSGTVNIDAHVSLNAMLIQLRQIGFDTVAMHNLELARRLSDFLQREAGLSPVLTLPASGIVCIRGDVQRLDVLYRRLKGFGVETTFFEGTAGLRFCCHFYHSEADIYALVGRIVSLMRT